MDESRPPEIFVLATGQDDNIGDVVLRRECFDRLRKIGHLHLFVGASSPDFLDGLRLQEADAIYASMRQWHSAAWRALARGKVWFVDKPGELQLDDRTVNRQLKLLPLVLATRVRRGQVLRLGMAMREANSRCQKRLAPMYRLSTKVHWRDTSTGSAFGFGAVRPDWAFAWGESDCDELDVDRDVVAISYREDRDMPSERLLDSLAALARDGSRRLIVVSQVRRDEQRSAELAVLLDAEHVSWPADRTLAEHEDILRELYRDCALVVSDRLHALIVGMTEGAVPLCVSDEGEAKVERHIAAAGFEGSTYMAGGTGVPLAVFEGQIARRSELLNTLRVARGRLDETVNELAALALKRDVEVGH